MSTYEHEIEIEAPIDYVFAWGVDPANWQRCMPSLTAVELIEEVDGGTRYQTTSKMLGRSATSESVFKILEPNAHTVTAIEGDMAGQMDYHYAEEGDRTTVRFVGEFEGADSLFERALQPVFNRYMNRQFRNHLHTMKDLVEAEYAAGKDVAGEVAAAPPQ